MMNTIVLDVDNVVTSHTPHPNYSEAIPCNFMRDTIIELRKRGHKVVLQTARWMLRANGDQFDADHYGRKELEDWLQEHQISHDGVYFGKASGCVYVDDLGKKFDTEHRQASCLAILNEFPAQSNFSGILSECEKVDGYEDRPL